MSETVYINITAKGKQGSGKTRAINNMLKSITSDTDFKITDSRFYEYPDEEQQTIELVLIK